MTKCYQDNVSMLKPIRGHPISVLGSPFWIGDPRTKMGIPIPKWGCVPNSSPFQNGDSHFELGIAQIPFRNGDYYPFWNGDPFSETGTRVQWISKPKWGSPFQNRTPYHNRDARSNMGTWSVTNPFQFGDVSNLGHGYQSPNWNGFQIGDPIPKWVSPFRFGQVWVKISIWGVTFSER